MMNTNKLALLILFVISSIIRISAQPSDYSDFYKNMSFLSDEKAYSKLLELRLRDPEFANTYAQLGAVTYKLMIKTDPLKEFGQTMKCVDDGILYLSLFVHFMADNEARAHKEFYVNLPINKTDDHFNNSDLRKYSENLTKEFRNYGDSLKLLYSRLEKSKEFYGNSINLYTSINKRFFSLNELLLQTDSLLIGEIEQLKKDFDSTIFYFNEYSELNKKFTLKDYHQNYKLKAIKTYRLDGLSNSNFLNDEFEIWDFGTWVSEFQSVYKNEILPLRQEITKINSWFIENEKLLADKKITPANMAKPIFDEKFIFILGKFDNNSLIRDLFLFRKDKVEFLKLYSDTLNSSSDAAADLLSRKARYYTQLKTTKFIVDSLLTVFEHAIKPEKIIRFNNFFNDVFKGNDGLVNFCNVQKKELNNLLSLSYANLGSYLHFLDQIKSSNIYVKYKSDSIPIFISNSDNSTKYLTNSIHMISGRPAYVSGFELSKTSIVPFVSYLNSQNKINWYKQIDRQGNTGKSDLNALSSVIYAYKDACIGLFSKFGSETGNIFAKLDTTGRLISQSSMPIDAMPVFLSFDDINQKALIACKGKNKTETFEPEATTICLTDSVGKIIWKSTFEITGNIVDIIKSENQYQVFINYKSYNIDGSSGSSISGGSEWGLLVLNIDETGKILKVIPLKQNYSMHVKNIVKLSGQSICLMGYKSPPGQESGELYFAIINSLGNLIYSN